MGWRFNSNQNDSRWAGRLANHNLANLPNLITTIRILGSPVLVLLAWWGQPWWLALLLVFLVFTEWADGFLARRLHANSPLGARLDTIADAVFYTSLLLAVVLLRPSLVVAERWWMVAAVGCYALSWLASWIKFRHLPSYHTWAAKGVWILVGIGVVCLLAEINPWPFRFAMTCVALANLEAVCITCVLPCTRVDVPSLWHAWQIKHEQSDGTDAD